MPGKIISKGTEGEPMILKVRNPSTGALQDLLADSSLNLKLNLAAQDLTRVTTRSEYGAGGKATGSNTTGSGWVTLVSITGEGVIHAIVVNTNAGTDSHNMVISLEIDGTEMRLWSRPSDLFTLINIGIGLNNDAPFQRLVKFNYNGPCCWFFSVPGGITFESSVLVQVNKANTYTSSAYVIYQLI